MRRWNIHAEMVILPMKMCMGPPLRAEGATLSPQVQRSGSACRLKGTQSIATLTGRKQGDTRLHIGTRRKAGHALSSCAARSNIKRGWTHRSYRICSLGCGALGGGAETEITERAHSTFSRTPSGATRYRKLLSRHHGAF